MEPCFIKYSAGQIESQYSYIIRYYHITNSYQTLGAFCRQENSIFIHFKLRSAKMPVQKKKMHAISECVAGGVQKLYAQGTTDAKAIWSILIKGRKIKFKP